MKVCFFSTEPNWRLKHQQYSILDIEILKSLGFDVIIANKFFNIPLFVDFYFSWWASGSFYPLIYAKLTRKPILVVAGGNEAMLYKDSKSGREKGYLASTFLKKIAIRLTLKFATKVIVVSRFMISDVKKLGCKNPILIRNCVNTQKFCIPEKGYRSYITTVFNLDTDVVELKRGIEFLLAIDRVNLYYPNVKVAIIGKFGCCYNKIVQIVNSYKLSNVELVGFVENSNMPYWYQRSLVYVQISDTETFGVSVAEAMSCGTPVVLSKKGALPELAGDCAIYVDNNSIHSISEGIIKALQMSKYEIDFLGKLLRKRIVERYSYNIRKDNISMLVNEILK